MCPKEAFDVAANGLSFFLSQYPHMNEEQLTKIEEVIRHYAKPEVRRGATRRQPLQCSVGPDGSLHISRHTLDKNLTKLI